MQVKRLSYRIKGFVRLADYAVRWTRMVTEKAKQRVKILAFWEKHDLETTIEAFGVSERTLYLWKAKQKSGDGKPEALNDQPKRPKNIRCREWPFVVKEEIRRLRQEHPNLGKEKIYEFLKVSCLEKNLICPSISTIGNLIRDMGGLRTFPTKVRHNGTIIQKKPQRKVRKPKYFIAQYPGRCGSFDTIEKIRHGCRHYVLTFTDLYSRFSFAWATNSHASQAAKEFFDLITFVFPFPLKLVPTDNGSEFMKHFDMELKRLHKIHWHTYPKCPKMNTHAERFNRTIQEEYIDFHEHEILNTGYFNLGLIKHLI